MPQSDRYDTVVIGGGFYGCSLAVHLRRARGGRVVLLEREPQPMLRASYFNQARVHHGYHYPRSVLTGLRSRVGFPRFAADMADCVCDDFAAYYAVARRFSNVTATQFRLFCERIGAPVEPAPAAVRRLFADHMIEGVFRVTEFAFDAAKLRARMLAELDEAGVEVRFGTEALTVRQAAPGSLEVLCRSQEAERPLTAGRVFNCTYARINRLLHASGLPVVPVKHEVTEIALVRAADELQDMAVTVMCGPFFSLMPFPSRGLHSLYHVRYAVHGAWHDADSLAYRDPYAVLAGAPRQTSYLRMVKDAARYVPSIAGCEYRESMWEVRTVLPISEHDDSRPILYVDDRGIEGLTCVLGAKIDNIYDMIEFEAQLG